MSVVMSDRCPQCRGGRYAYVEWTGARWSGHVHAHLAFVGVIILAVLALIIWAC